MRPAIRLAGPLRTAKTAIYILLICAMTFPAAASLNKTGVNSAQFLLLGAGARSLGLGEAYGPIAEGPEAIYWNPAGLAGIKRPELSYTRTILLFNHNHDFAAYAHPVRLLSGTLAASFTHLTQEALPVISQANISQGISFKPRSEAFAIAYARKFSVGDVRTDREYFKEAWNIPWVNRPLYNEREPWTGALMAGISMKIINETFYQRRATAFAWDGGVIYRPIDLQRLSLSAVFRNVGTKERFNIEDESLPMEFDVGAAYDLRLKSRSRLLTAVELAVPYYGTPNAKVGVEYSWPLVKNVSIAMRLGYKSLTVSDLGMLSGLTFGAGSRWKKLSLDFAFEPLGELGEAYRMGASWRF